MKKIFYTITCIALSGVMMSCGGSKKEEKTDAKDDTKEVVDDGFVTIFDGKTFDGWRGMEDRMYLKKWTIEDGAIKFNGAGGGEAQDGDGGDLIFATKYKNFELELEWKVSKGGNSGIFYLAQETVKKDKPGEYEPIYISAPEFQVLTTKNHPDAKLGVDGNRKSASLYDMIPADPQNAKPHGEWNKAKIMVYKGTVVHGQNGANVLEYHLWTPQWTEMLQASKFSEKKWPIAFDLLNNCGGENREGYIGLQDHGDDVWFRKFKGKSNGLTNDSSNKQNIESNPLKDILQWT